MLELFRRISLRRILLHPFRLGLTLLGISLGVALFVAIQLINQATLRGFRESVESMTGKAQLSVLGPETGFDETIVEKVAAVPGVKTAVPMVQNKAYYQGDDGSYQNLVVLGLDLLKETAVRSYKTENEELMADPLEFLNQADSIIVTRKFADARGLKLESPLELGTSGGKKKLTVRGVLSPEGPAKAFGGSLAIMDIDAARFTFSKEGKVDRIDLVLTEDANEDTVLRNVNAVVKPFGVYAEKPEGQSQALGEMVRSYQQLLTIFSTLALIVGVFLIDNTVRTSIAERRREIASLRALGASRGTLFSIFVAEALFQGLLGSLLGIAIGRLLGEALVSFVSASMSAQFVTPIDVSTLKLGANQAAIGIAIGVVCTLVATLKPAYSITKINAIEALKNPASNDGTADGSRTQFYLGLGSIAALVAIAAAKPWLGSSTGSVLGLIAGAAAVWWGGPYLSLTSLRLVRALLSNPKLSSRWSAPLRLSSENLLLNPSRTKSNIMALVIGILLVLALSTLSQSFRTSIVGWFERTLRSDLLVFSAGNLISTQVQPVDESLALELAKIPSVDPGVGNAVTGMRIVKVPFRGKEIQLKAFDPPHPAVGYAAFDMVEGDANELGPRFFAETTETAVLVSDNLARNFGVKTGDRIQLDTPTGPRQATVIGLVTDFVSPVGVIYLQRTIYREWWKDRLVTTFGVQARAGVSIEQLRRDIDDGFARSRGLITASNTELRSQASQVIDEGFGFTRAIELCALLVGLLGLLNTMLVSILSRIRELGILRALGMSKAQQQLMILGEALFSSLSGAAVAIALGLFLSRFVLVDAVSQAIGWRIRYSFPESALGLAVVAGLAVGVLAGVLPARRAGRITIKEALEYE